MSEKKAEPMTFYNNHTLKINGCESNETTLRTKILLSTVTLTRMSDGRLPKRIEFGTLRVQCGEDRAGKRKGRSIVYRATSRRLT